MLKTTYESENKELKMWVDPDDGSLNVTVQGETVSVPEELGRELINIIKNKQTLFADHQWETEKSKMSFFTRFFRSFKVGNPRSLQYETI